MDQVRFIGKVHSSLKHLRDCPLQESEGAPVADIEIFNEYLGGISHLRPGDNLIVLTWLHLADRSVLSTRPRNDPKAPVTGVFATRSPDRPNPIGIHYVKVISLNNGMLKVSGLEVLDQTPVIDIKPELRVNVLVS